MIAELKNEYNELSRKIVEMYTKINNLSLSIKPSSPIRISDRL